MTLLSVVRGVCSVVGVSMPQSVFSGLATNRTMQEMVELANEMSQRIAYDTREWTKLLYAVVINGDGVQQGFTLPANFKRMMLNTNVVRLSTPTQPMRFIPDYNEWLDRGFNKINDPRGEWIMVGEKIYTRPILSTGDGIHFTYIDKNCVNLNSGGQGDAYLNDLDTFRLDERLLKLGMIWQWKAQKGSPYAEDMGTYGDALTYAMGSDKPSPIIVGRLPVSAYMRGNDPWAMP